MEPVLLAFTSPLLKSLFLESHPAFSRALAPAWFLVSTLCVAACGGPVLLRVGGPCGLVRSTLRLGLSGSSQGEPRGQAVRGVWAAGAPAGPTRKVTG